MAAAIATAVVAEWLLWLNSAFFFEIFATHRVGLTRPNPIRISHAKGDKERKQEQQQAYSSATSGSRAPVQRRHV